MLMPTPLEFSLVVNFVLFIGLMMSLLNRKEDINCCFKLIAKDLRIKELEETICEMNNRVDEIVNHENEINQQINKRNWELP